LTSKSLGSIKPLPETFFSGAVNNHSKWYFDIIGLALVLNMYHIFAAEC